MKNRTMAAKNLKVKKEDSKRKKENKYMQCAHNEMCGVAKWNCMYKAYDTYNPWVEMYAEL